MTDKMDGNIRQKPNKLNLGRTLFLMIVCGAVAFIVLAARLYKVQIVDHQYYESLALEQQTSETTVSAARGTITDANGNVLAMSATAYNVYISPYEIQKYGESAEFIAENLSQMLGVDKQDILDKSTNTDSWYETVAKKIDADLADKVRQFKSDNDLKGVHVEQASKRYYPYGSLACQVIGFVGTDDYGLSGLESQYDKYLEGTDGSIVRLKSGDGTDILNQNYEYYYDAVDGDNVQTTLDVNIQSIAEKYLQQAIADNDVLNGGCAIVMDVNTGAIKAMASYDNFDLNDYSAVSAAKQAELDKITDKDAYNTALAAAQYEQWRNKALSDTYEPGSVFKIITLATALEENLVNENSTFYCGGSIDVLGRDADDPLNCWKTAGHGTQTLAEAAQHSCNVAFVQIGLLIGAKTSWDYYHRFGLFDETGIDLGGEADSQWWDEATFCDPENESSLAAASFGQTFNVTPLQMITAVSAAANGGYLLKPYVVSSVTDASGNVVLSNERTVVRQVISEETSKRVCSILESVVSAEGGTGKNAYVAGYRIAGKTGTTTKTATEAATGKKEYMVSFCGIAPADDPKYAILVILDNPSQDSGIYISGGGMVAPVVGGMFSEILPYAGIEPTYTEDEKASADVTLPSVVQSGLADAENTLTSLGVETRVIGNGDTVVAQLPAANAAVAPGTTVLLYTEGAPPGEQVSVPNLSGMTADQAKEALQSVGLFLNSSGATGSDAVVSKQYTAAGEQVAYGTVVKVTFSDSSIQGQY